MHAMFILFFEIVDQIYIYQYHIVTIFLRPNDSRGVYNNSIVQKNGKGLKSVQNIKQKSAKIRVTSNLLRTKFFFIIHKYGHIKFPLVCVALGTF